MKTVTSKDGTTIAFDQQLHGMGPKAIGQLREALGAKGISFAEEKKRMDEA